MDLNFLIPFLANYGILISFLGGFITGESVIIPLSFFSAMGFLPAWNILIFSTLGMILSNFIPFLIGRSGFLYKFFKFDSPSKSLVYLEQKIIRYSKNKLFLKILYAKLIYGASIPMLIYLGHKKTRISSFTLASILADIIFVPLIFIIGWYAGKGFGLFEYLFKDLRIILLALVIFLILFYFIKKWISEIWLIRKQRLLK